VLSVFVASPAAVGLPRFEIRKPLGRALFVRRLYRVGVPVQPARKRGLYSTRGLAEALGVPIHRVQYWAEQGRLTPVEGGNGRPAWYRVTAAELDSLRARLLASSKDRDNHSTNPPDKLSPDQGGAL